MTAPTPLSLFLTGWAMMAGFQAVLWLVQRARRDAGVVDVGWAAGLGILALYYAWADDGWLPRRLLLATLVSIWSFRLAFYLLRDRVLHAKEEDGRYQALRAAWGKRAQPWFFLFFQAQGLLDSILSIPFLIILGRKTGPFTPWALDAVAVWLVAVTGESIADRQLAAWRADPANRGRTCRSGLWAWSRHPNYFFEWLHWWTYPLLAIGAPWAAATLFAPAFMLFFLFKVTGIPATEARALVTRGEDYRRYQREVPMFLPWPPRRRAGAEPR
jgi:steroid 5-alpha reductase family enzyme